MKKSVIFVLILLVLIIASVLAFNFSGINGFAVKYIPYNITCVYSGTQKEGPNKTDTDPYIKADLDLYNSKTKKYSRITTMFDSCKKKKVGKVYQNFVKEVYCIKKVNSKGERRDSIAYKSSKDYTLCDNGCKDGACVSVNITCNFKSDCEKDGFIGNTFCQGNSTFQNFITYTCNNPRTINSFCNSSTSPQLKQICTEEQICSNGTCVITSQDCYLANQITEPSTCIGNECKILIIVESEIYSQIQGSLNVFEQDIKNELGWNTEINQISRKSHARDIKSIINTSYYGNKKLVGVYLMGSIPSARVGLSSFGISGIVLSDQAYYQDILNKCKYNESGDLYNCTYSQFPFMPPFWVTRITPQVKLNITPYSQNVTEEQRIEYMKVLKSSGYFIGQNQNVPYLEVTFVDSLNNKIEIISIDNDRANLINQFFKNNHRFRTGQMQFINEPLIYTPVMNDQVYITEKERLINSMTKSLNNAGYSNSTIHFLNDSLNENQEFLSYISQPYEYAFINAHGTSTGHQYDVDSNNIVSNTLILKIKSCSVGDFTYPDYLLGNYLFSGKSQFVDGSSTVPVAGTVSIAKSEILGLTSGKRFFEINEVFSDANYMGDPTLKMRYSNQYANNKRLCLSENKLDFGVVDNEKQINVVVYNKKDSSLRINLFGGEIADISSQGYLFFDNQLSNNEQITTNWFKIYTNNKLIELSAGQSLNFSVTISKDNFLPGDYKGFIYINTDDSTNPILKLPIYFSISD